MHDLFFMAILSPCRVAGRGFLLIHDLAIPDKPDEQYHHNHL
jgi:hypothetical protein